MVFVFPCHIWKGISIWNQQSFRWWFSVSLEGDIRGQDFNFFASIFSLWLLSKSIWDDLCSAASFIIRRSDKQNRGPFLWSLTRPVGSLVQLRGASWGAWAQRQHRWHFTPATHRKKNKHTAMKLRINFHPVQCQASYQSNKEPPLVQGGNKAPRWACWNWLPSIFVLPLMTDRECNHILWKWSPGSWNGRSEEKVSFISQGRISMLNASRQPVSKDIGDNKEREGERQLILVSQHWLLFHNYFNYVNHCM